VFKERLDEGWKMRTVDWVNGTMKFCIALWEARQDQKANQNFGKWLEKLGYGDKVLNHQNRSAFIQMGKPEHREVVGEVLSITDRHNPEGIWSEEVKPLLIKRGIMEPAVPAVLRVARNTRNNIAQNNEDTANIVPSASITQPPVENKPVMPTKRKMPTEHEMALAESEALGETVTVVFGEPPKIGRMPDDTGEKIHEKLQELYHCCEELYQLCMYHEQMSTPFKEQLAPHFRSIEQWGRMLIRLTFGLNKKETDKIQAPLCHINIPLRKEGNA
jgi:hypothetical protein